MFEIKSSKKRFDANKVTITNNGFPYIARLGLNNGQRGFINESIQYLNEGNTISFGQDTATIYYQGKPYFTGDKIKIFKPKNKSFGKHNAQFILSAMNKSFAMFSWGSSSFNVNVLGNVVIQLPIKNKEIDFDFMEYFITELEKNYAVKLDKYLSAAGLKNYVLTLEEQQAIQDYEKVKWKDFYLVDLFDIKNTYSILSREVLKGKGDTPYLCASTENNAVDSYVEYDKKYLDEGNCIFIGGKTFVVTYQEKDFYSNDSHNLALYLKEKDKRNKQTQLYLAACVNKSLKHKYTWGDSISKTKIRKDKILLPVKNNQPDYETMETLMSAIHKLVIKDVVLYSEQKTKQPKSF